MFVLTYLLLAGYGLALVISDALEALTRFVVRAVRLTVLARRLLRERRATR